jgi:hypothetical protein
VSGTPDKRIDGGIKMKNYLEQKYESLLNALVDPTGFNEDQTYHVVWDGMLIRYMVISGRFKVLSVD